MKLRIAGAARIEEDEDEYWHQFSYTIYRLAKKVGKDGWEGRPETTSKTAMESYL